MGAEDPSTAFRPRLLPASRKLHRLMALPKVKRSKSKKGRRRSHLALALVMLQPCPNCKKPRRPHTICTNCGFYKGREVIKTA